MPRDGIRVTRDFSRLNRLIQRLPDKGDSALAGAAQNITNDIVLSFGTSPSGRTYKRGGVSHVASVAGYPPNVDIGSLKNSMRWERVRNLHYEIMDGVTYGEFLELGTSKMAARPFFTPIFEEWRARKFEQHMERELDVD